MLSNILRLVSYLSNTVKDVIQYRFRKMVYRCRQPPETPNPVWTVTPAKLLTSSLTANNLTRCSSIKTENSKPTSGIKHFNVVVNIRTSCRFSISYPTSTSKQYLVWAMYLYKKQYVLFGVMIGRQRRDNSNGWRRCGLSCGRYVVRTNFIILWTEQSFDEFWFLRHLQQLQMNSTEWQDE